MDNTTPADTDKQEKRKAPPLTLFGWSGCGWLGLCILIIVGGSYFRLARELSPKNIADNDPAVAESIAPLRALPGFKTFTASATNVPSHLVRHLVPFGFRYPEKFHLVEEQRPTAFVTIEERDPDTDIVLEKLGVSYFSAGPLGLSDIGYRTLVGHMSNGLDLMFNNYQELEQAPWDVDYYHGRSLTFRATVPGIDGREMPIYGRVIFVGRQQDKKGLALIMFASALDPNVKSAADIGVKGDLREVLRSFDIAP